MSWPRTLHVAPTAAEASRHAAGLLADIIRNTPRARLGLATGGTMLALYAALLDMQDRGALRLDALRAFNLDEYRGLSADDPQSYAAEMRRIFFNPAGIPSEHTDIPCGTATDSEAEAARYEQAIAAAGGIDCQLLGLGTNGHIGFNEPGSSADSRTRSVTLAEDTIAANALHFPPGRTVPREAISMGVGTILDARRIVLLATGPAKAEAVRAMIEGPESPACPASFLRRHGHVDIVLDVASAGRLPPR